MEGSDGKTILDGYEVNYDGLAKPTTLYIDEYHFSDLRAPIGFVCGQPIGLGLPPLDPLLISQTLVRVAIEQGTVRDIPPIPLDQDGATTHGLVFDHFRMIARAARAAAATGTKLDPLKVPADVARPRTVVLAYPLSCDGRTVAPAAIEIVGAQGAPPRRDGEYARDSAIGAILPGVQTPVSSLAATFTLPTLRPGDAVRITYADPACTGGNPELSLAVKFSDVRSVDMSAPTLPSGLTPSDAPVWLQTLTDLDGRLQHPEYIGGPAHLAQAAIEAVQRWRSEPARINGAPIVRPVMIPVKFKQ
jgi:hypothetical protein